MKKIIKMQINLEQLFLIPYSGLMDPLVFYNQNLFPTIHPKILRVIF